MLGVKEILGYEVMGTLGYGARSTIFAVKDGDSHIFALKRVVKQSPSDQRFLDQAVREHEVASQLDHPSLRKSYKLIKQRALLRTSEVLVLMEMVDGPTMEQFKPRNLLQLVRLCRRVAQGLSSMHLAGFVHADIKPNNILVTGEDSVKIIDFGQSCPIGTIKPRIQGTPDYIAPEQVLRRQITPATDVFNLGASMYWLFTQRHVPTLIPKEVGTVLKDDSGLRPARDLNPQVPPALSALVMDCLTTEPSGRPASMALVADRLELAVVQLSRTAKGSGGNHQG